MFGTVKLEQREHNNNRLQDKRIVRKTVATPNRWNFKTNQNPGIEMNRLLEQ